MSYKDLHGFSSDRPIKNIEDDLFDRAKFAKDIAQALSSWHGKDSLVVALHGDWGSGKSSIKNMAVTQLEKMQNKPDVIEFSPWEWAAQDKITAAFFQEISLSLGQKKEEKKLATIFKKYSEYLSAGKSIAEEFSSSVLPSLYVLLPFLSAAGIFADDGLFKSIFAALLTGIGIAAAFINWGRSVLDKFGNSEMDTKELSLNQLKNKLRELLSKREKSLLIIMDDLDRLTSEQLRMVFQLVKANTEFPNVVFLLLFQRDLVEEKLNDGKQIGRDYLEKIIQVPFDIPKIEISRVHNLLFKNLDQLLEKNEFAVDMFDDGYWGNVFYSSLFAYFDNLRNVYRFSSTVSFHFSLFQGQNAFEVNPVDLIAIECLRVFEPEIYKEIANSKALFTTNRNGLRSSQVENIEPLITKIISKSTEGKSEYVKELIKRIFPTVECALGGAGYDGSFSSSWFKAMRICHPSNFDKYFQLSIPGGEISNSELQEMVTLTSNREELRAFLISLNESKRLKNALIQFGPFIEETPITNIRPFILAALDIGDEVDHERIAFSMASPNTCLNWLVVDFLRRINDLTERGVILLDCFKNSQGISIIERILQGDENRREKATGNYFLADEEFNALKREFVRKLDNLSLGSPKELLQNGHLLSFLYRWQRWGDRDNICSWLREQIGNPETCMLVLHAFIQKSYSIGSNDHVEKMTKYINPNSIGDFIPIDEIVEKTRLIDESVLTKEDQEVLVIFNSALEHRNKGEVEL